jgi:hypothetical protein
MADMNLEQIDAAEEAGIITAAQARAMRAKLQSELTVKNAPEDDPGTSVIGNEDDMRFVRSFSDVFIAIGIGLFSIGVFVTAILFGGGISFLLAALVMAVLAEYFGRKKRQHLPTLITALAFLVFTARGLNVVLPELGFGGSVTVAITTLAAMLLFYVRVRLPFCLALIAISLLYLVFSVIESIAPNIMRSGTGWVLFAGGVVTMMTAMWYDMKDRHRTTRFSDNAFWLHFTAAPLIIHGLALELVRVNTQKIANLVPMPALDKGDAGILIILVLVVALFGLAINRRALLVSSLGYAAFAIAFLMKDTGLGVGKITAFTLLILGAAIIFLGAGWHRARNGLIKVLPKWGIFPPPFDPNYKP